MARLGDIATYVNGYAFKPSDWSDTGLPIIRIQDLTGNSYQANRYDGEYDKKYEVNAGDILISWSASLGVYVWDGEKAVLNQHIFKVVFDKAEVDKSFFLHQVQNVLENAASQAHGATMKHLTKPIFDALPFYLPPMKDQQSIASILDKISYLISLRKQQLDKLDELVKARFVEMFGDPEQNPMRWDERPLSALIINANNGMARRGNDPEGSIVMRLVELQDGYIDYSMPNRIVLTDVEKRKYLLRDGDFLFARVNGNPEYVGRCTVFQEIGEPIYHNDHIIRVHFNDAVLNGVFASTLLNSAYGKRQMCGQIKTSAGQYTISQDGIGAIVTILPPLDLQNQFAAFAEQIGKYKLTIQQSLDKMEVLKKSLMQEYFG